MIQKFNLNINTFINSNSFIYSNPLPLDDFQNLLAYLFDHLDSSNYHFHYDTLCKSPNLIKFSSYSRNYITFSNHKVLEGTVDIPVVYCCNDEHYHALLPLNILVPYCQYSLSFILSVIFDKYYSNLTVEAIVDKYHIAKSTIYRWIKKYSSYLRFYYRLKHQYHYSVFISLRYLFHDVLNDLFDICALTFFQCDRKLSSPPS